MQIVNPIYDVAFKFLMSSDKSAKILLSALLRRKVVSLTDRSQEGVTTVSVRGRDLTTYRMDYVASLLTDEGKEETVCVELQKVWLETELMRFRGYLAGRYADEDNVERDGTPMHIVAIYLLGHTICETNEPIVYCLGGRMTDFDGNLVAGGDGKFVRSLTHDVIIVQIPRLPQRPRNATEKILSIFDQRFKTQNRHLLDMPDTDDENPELRTLTRRLSEALESDDVLNTMRVEDEFLKEIDIREAIAKREIEKRDKIIEDRERAIEDRDKTIRNAIVAMSQSGMSDTEIAASLGITLESVRQARLRR